MDDEEEVEREERASNLHTRARPVDVNRVIFGAGTSRL